MFRAPQRSSSGESIVLIRHLVHVTLCRWPDGHLHRVTYTRCHINTIDSPDDERWGARNMWRSGMNIYEKKRTVRQVGYLQELHRDARSTEHKIGHIYFFLWIIRCFVPRFLVSLLNLLQPTRYVMHHQFNIQQLYALPALYLCVLYLSGNKQRLVPLTA